MRPAPDGTRVVEGLLAASLFTAGGGPSSLTFAAFLAENVAKVQVFFNFVCHFVCHLVFVEVSLWFTSLLPRFTSVNTSVTEKPNRSSNSGELWQKMPEAYN